MIIYLFLTINIFSVKAEPIEILDQLAQKLQYFLEGPVDPENSTNFFLFTQRNKNNSIQLFENNTEILNKTKPFKYITHGFIENAFKKHYFELKNALLQKGDYNVIMVDWRRSALTLYLQAYKNVKEVGKAIGMHILKNKIPLDRTELIGHSLGAHVMGHAGKYIAEISEKKLWRIVALDASGPLYELNDDSNSLAYSDAQNVIAIHTDGGVFGMLRPLGTIDFYVNGGTALQPGCENDLIPEGLSVGDIFTAAYDTLLCSHGRSIEYFIEGVNSDKFIASRCPFYFLYIIGLCHCSPKIIMGENTPDNAEGIYHLMTNRASPYAKGE